jgi:hypothetical protein
MAGVILKGLLLRVDGGFFVVVLWWFVVQTMAADSSASPWNDSKNKQRRDTDPALRSG